MSFTSFEDWSNEALRCADQTLDELVRSQSPQTNLLRQVWASLQEYTQLACDVECLERSLQQFDADTSGRVWPSILVSLFSGHRRWKAEEFVAGNAHIAQVVHVLLLCLREQMQQEMLTLSKDIQELLRQSQVLGSESSLTTDGSGHDESSPG